MKKGRTKTKPCWGSMWCPGESQHTLRARSKKSCYLSGCRFCPCHSFSVATSTGFGAWVSSRLSSGEVLEISIILFLLLVYSIIAASHDVSYLKTSAVRTSYRLHSFRAPRRRKGRRQQKPCSTEYLRLRSYKPWGDR